MKSCLALKKRVLLILGICQIFTVFCARAQAEGTDFVKYVNPYIGTGGHGHTFVAASVPFGMVQIGPNGFNKGWDWCSGYHYSDKVLRGFSHMHLSGTGCSDLGDVLMMPYTGRIKVDAGNDRDPDRGYASRFSHDRETVSPYYYAVMLDDYKTKVELTATERAALHRYHFPAEEATHVVIDLQHGSTDRPHETFMKQIDKKTFVGYRFSSGWARDLRVFFAVRLQQNAADFHVYSNHSLLKGTAGTSDRLKGVISFAASEKPMMLKVGISPVSMENALANIDAEMPDWNFEKVVEHAKQKWNQELNKIKIATDDPAVRTTFYTAFYHTLIAPTLFNDHNRQYLGTDKKVYSNVSFDNYTIFSLWDTYRALHPLLTITQPNRLNDMIQSMLAIYEQQDVLPVWHLWGNETWTMVGYHAVPVIADAYLKGFDGFDKDLAYQAMKDTSVTNRDGDGVKYIKEKGYIPADKEKESVAKALEYSIDDACIARVAKARGQEDDYRYYKKRGKAYEQYFDSDIQFMRGRMNDGSWRTPFDPVSAKHRDDDYCEGNAWQYTWLVPQDPQGLINLFGSEEAFTAKLDTLFSMSSKLGEGASMDISGLIGQYAHGNEPGHHIPYLYAFAGQQWKTAEKVRHIMSTMYNDTPEGLCGNEDCGQMSAWYILSAMGFYPVDPAAGKYVLGSPAVEEAQIRLPGGNVFSLQAQNNSLQNIYIQSVTYNGKPYTKSYITHQMIMDGGQFILEMGSTPNKSFANDPPDRPNSPL